MRPRQFEGNRPAFEQAQITRDGHIPCGSRGFEIVHRDVCQCKFLSHSRLVTREFIKRRQQFQ